MECGIIASKTVLLLISLIFWAIAAGLSYVGAYLIQSYSNFRDFVQDKNAIIPAAIVITVAVVMFIIGLVGCIATIKESKCGLGVFLFIILIIFVAEVAAVLCGFLFSRRIKGSLEQSMSLTFGKYDGNSAASKAVDTLQEKFECCGVTNYTNWSNTTWYRSHNNTVPASCCKNATGVCPKTLDQPTFLNTQGCEAKVEKAIQDVLSYALLVVLGIAILKLVGMISICVIMCKSDRSGYEQFYA
ncbi:tetraspanin 36 [Engraulis encrasicolus]|uniref:tetraspanin 36 n=1 Tax=Engraulis encrasicolus TaxID=184585 RepID=UPI002FD6DB50